MNFGPITCIEKIAQGGVADIFLAKMFAVSGQEKYLICKCAKDPGDPEFNDSIQTEAFFAELLHHPNVLDIFERRENNCLVMEYMDAYNFHKLLQICAQSNQRVPYGLAIYAVGQAALGLHAAHELTDKAGNPLQTVHRDISPENILFSRQGDIKISDFGIAVTSSNKDNSEQIQGKFNYMSPEQAWGDCLDRRSDIFSLAIVLYEATTGCRFNPADNPDEAVKNAQFGLFVPPHELVHDFPQDLEQILAKSLDLDRNLRFNTALDFKEAIDSCASRHGWSAPQNLWRDYLQNQFGLNTEPLPRMTREEYSSLIRQPQPFEQHVRPNTNPCAQKDIPTSSTEFLVQKFDIQRENMNTEDNNRTEALPAPSLEMLKAIEKQMQQPGSVLDDVFNAIDAEKCLHQIQKEKSHDSALDAIFNSIDAEKAEVAKIQSQSQTIPTKESSLSEPAKIKRTAPKVFKSSIAMPIISKASASTNDKVTCEPQDSASIALEEFLKMEQESSEPQDSASAALEEFLKMEQENEEKTQDSASIANEERQNLEQKSNEPQDSASAALEEFLRMEQESSEPQDSASAALEEFLRMEQESSESQDSASEDFDDFVQTEDEETESRTQVSLEAMPDSEDDESMTDIGSGKTEMLPSPYDANGNLINNFAPPMEPQDTTNQNESAPNAESPDPSMPFGYDPSIENIQTISGTCFDIQQKKLRKPASKLNISTIILIIVAFAALCAAGYLVYVIYFYE